MQPGKILLVDDDWDDIEIITEALLTIDPGINIVKAANGEEAIKVLNEGYKTLCLVVLDLNMPKLNGTKTLKEIKTNELFKNISVIIYSTSMNPMEKEECMKLGAYDYITKPVSYKESIQTANIFLSLCTPG